jgi:acyl carrier protein
MSTNAKAVWNAAAEIIGAQDRAFDAHTNLSEIGLDSLGLAELVIQLEDGLPAPNRTKDLSNLFSRSSIRCRVDSLWRGLYHDRRHIS